MNQISLWLHIPRQAMTSSFKYLTYTNYNGLLRPRGSHNAVTVCRWDSTKMNLINTGWEGVADLSGSGQALTVGPCEHGLDHRQTTQDSKQCVHKGYTVFLRASFKNNTGSPTSKHACNKYYTPLF